MENVTRVIDGDTFDTRTRRIRLANVNAPELGRPGGTAAKRRLESLIDGEVVLITDVGESYGRTVSEVELNGKSINQMMINFLKQ